MLKMVKMLIYKHGMPFHLLVSSSNYFFTVLNFLMDVSHLLGSFAPPYFPWGFCDYLLLFEIISHTSINKGVHIFLTSPFKSPSDLFCQRIQLYSFYGKINFNMQKYYIFLIHFCWTTSLLP